jgi:uncharacterized protein
MMAIPEDMEFEAFRAACSQRRLVVQECVSCGRLRWPPRPICGYCYSSETSWAGVSGGGVLFSWTVVGSAQPGQAGVKIPCIVAIAELAEDRSVRFLAAGRGLSEVDLRPGLGVAICFQDRGDGLVLPYWAPARDESGTPPGPKKADP